MNFEEHAGKAVLAAAGIAVPRGELVTSPEAAAAACRRLGPAVVKAQVPTGKRGKAGGIAVVDDADAARAAAERILGMSIGGHPVERLLVEGRAAIRHEFYAAVLDDPDSKGPMVMLSSAGGMDIEEVAERHPQKLVREAVDVRSGLDEVAARAIAARVGSDVAPESLADFLVRLYRAWRDADAELLEVNPLAVLDDGSLVALDCKLTVDDSAVVRQAELAATGSPERLSDLEARGRDLGLKYIELDGDIGVLANGAGLTMTTMDVIAHHGGRPANFLEIGGESYTKAEPALALVLDNPRVRSLVVNFCGAFARTDVMTAGVLDAFDALRPTVPAFFSVHGTGSTEARAMLRERLGREPYPTMDEAIAAAVAAARGAEGGR